MGTVVAYWLYRTHPSCARRPPMAFQPRLIAATAQFSEELTLQALDQFVTHADVLAVLAAQGRTTPRERKLNLPATCYLSLGLHLFPHCSIKRVFAHLA